MKIVRGYSLKAENLKWLVGKAAEKMAQTDRAVSVSGVLDEVIERAREEEAREKRKKSLTPPRPSPKGEGVR